MKASLKTHKKILVIAGTLLILLISLGLSAYFVLINEMSFVHSSMRSTMTTFENKYKRIGSFKEVSEIINEETTLGSEYLIKVVFKETEDIQTALDTMKRDYFDCYLIDSEGKMYISSGSPLLDISKEEYDQLLTKGTLTSETDDGVVYYGCMEMPQGLLITCYKKSMELGTGSLLTGISDRFDYFAAPASDRIIKSASDTDIIGTHAPDSLVPSSINADRDIRIKGEGYNHGLADLSIGKAYCITCEIDGYIYGLYFKQANMLRDVFNEIKTPAVVLAGTFAVILIFFFNLWNASDEKEKKWIRIFRTNSWFDEVQARCLSGFTVLAMIVTLFFNTHFTTFSSYSLQSTLSTQNLDMLAENIKACEKDRKVLAGIIEDYTQSLADHISDLLVMNRDLCSHESLKEMSEKCCISEISVYDEEARVEASSGDYYGYKLTDNEDDPAYGIRRILTDNVESVFVDYDDETGRFLLGQRRKDSPGIILLKYEDPNLTKMLKYYSKDEAIRGTDFGNATTFFVKLGDEDVTYVIEPYSTQIEATQLRLPENLEQDNYSGIAEIRGKPSYVNTRSSEGIAVVSAIECNRIDIMLVSCSLIMIAAFVLLMAVLFYGCVCHPEKAEDPAEENVTPEEEVITDRSRESLFADTCFRKMIKYESIVLVVGYCFMMFKLIVGEQTVLSFIFGGKWDKGINLFSVNASIIVAVITIVLLFLLKKILEFIGRSIGTKGMTICSVAASVISFFALFFIILHTLYQFGVNTTALMASAGIAGLVIGIAAKDIFGDLIAGLFLIFEGNIRVGDFISYKDFRGEVSEIGARVTVLKRYNNKLIVNNSDLKQYYRLSDEPGSAWVEIDVDVNEDIDKIRELIENSAEWYQNRIPTLLKGPWFLNISKLDSTCMTVCLCGLCPAERSGSTRRKILLYTRQLFCENGIKLGTGAMKIALMPEDQEKQ